MKRFESIRVLTVAVLALLLGMPAQGFGQSSERPVQLVVGFPPGQSVDIVGRLLAERLSGALGRNVVVDNKPGQGGSLALGLVAKSPADGSTYTLAALAALVANPHLYRNVPYDTLRDFEPIGLVYEAPLMLLVNPALPAKTVPELVAYAKQNPDRLTHSSSGNGTVSHLGMVSFKQRAGITMTHVPYPGSAKALLDLMSGNVQVAMETVASALPLVRSGKLRALAVCSNRRLPALPDLPTVAELGFEGFEAVAWIGLLAPAGLPKELVQRVSAELSAVTRSEDFATRLVAMGALPRASTPSEFAAYLREEHRKWGELVKQSGAKVD